MVSPYADTVSKQGKPHTITYSGIAYSDPLLCCLYNELATLKKIMWVFVFYF
jgi:hypothetical protein